ncbi:MAG: LysR family transcriptional regulator [Verrucomicrobiota bacterium]
MKDLNSVRIFLAVVEHASFTAAAKRLGLPKGTVSYKVSELEAELGVRLLNRTTRAVTPTSEGSELAERCGPSLENIIEASAWIAQAGKVPSGLLRIKAPTTYTQWAVAQALPRFLAAYPQLKIALSVSDDFRTDIVQQGIDLVVSVGPNHDSSFIRFPLGHSVRRLYASKTYLKAHPMITRLEDLKNHACLICAEPGPGYAWSLTNKGKTRTVAVSGPLVSTDYVPLVEAARQGLGVALLPERICGEHLAAGRLVPVLSEWVCNTPEFNALIPSKKLLTPKVKAFIEFLKANPW